MRPGKFKHGCSWDRMTSKARMLAFLNGGVPDRVPSHYRGTNEVTEKLLAYFDTTDFEVVRRELGIDGWRHVSPGYLGPELRRFEDGSWESLWGTQYKSVAYDTGSYAEKCYFPLQHATKAKELDRYRWPEVDWWDFESVAREIALLGGSVINSGYYSLFEKFNDLKPLEECLTDIICEPGFVRDVFERLHRYWMAFNAEIFRLNQGKVHMTIISDDVGMQDRLMMRPSTWGEFFAPFYREYIEMAHGYGVKVVFHSDGSINEILPDLIECGIDVLDPVQYRCPGMEREYLKETYGDRLKFSGAVENQQVLPFGSVEQVEAEARECMRTLGRGGGYVLSSCHKIQPITPVENIIAMYRMVRDEGHLYL